MSGHRAAFHPLRVAAIDELTDDALAVTFDVPPGLAEDYAFSHGQHLNIRGGDDVRRSYSICTPPSSRVLRIGVKRLPGGAFSEGVLDRLRVGDELEVMTPAGRFTTTLDPEARKTYVAIAAGSGITPVLSIVASVLAAHPDTRVTLIYGNRRTDTVMFTEELADLKNAHGPRLHLLHVLSREPMEAEIFTGRLDADKIRTIVTALVDVDDVDQWWLCGPLGMTEAAVEVLTGLGVDRRQLHRELFYVDEPPPELQRADDAVEGETSEVTVVLNGRATTMALSRAEPVLDTAQRVRGDLPFACKGGVCGTCRARLTEGEVTMRRNFALEDEEVEAGFVLTCQSRPVSEAVTVDFDT
jgi:ring-1,2-phenylacetyl-CoA epoxidase subunit PaaE